MKNNQSAQVIWLFVEIFAVVRSAIATFNVVLYVGGDVTFAIFTTATIELALFAMLTMAGNESVAPLAALVLISFSAVLQYCEIALMQNLMDAQSKQILTYAISFSPSVLLLFGLTKRLIDRPSGAGLLDSLRGIFGRNAQGQSEKTFAADVQLPRGKAWTETRKRYRDVNGRKRTLPKRKRQ